MKYLVLLILIGCGGTYTIGGEATIKHQIDISNLEDYFTKQCARLHPTFDDIQLEDCMLQEVDDFLKALNLTR